jgi:putative transposase
MVVSRRDRCVPTRPNEVWSLDFVADQLASGTRLRALTVVDVFSLEALAIEIGQRLRAEDVVSELNRLVAQRPGPLFLFADNGSEFPSGSHPAKAYSFAVQLLGFSHSPREVDRPQDSTRHWQTRSVTPPT